MSTQAQKLLPLIASLAHASAFEDRQTALALYEQTRRLLSEANAAERMSDEEWFRTYETAGPRFGLRRAA